MFRTVYVAMFTAVVAMLISPLQGPFGAVMEAAGSAAAREPAPQAQNAGSQEGAAPSQAVADLDAFMAEVLANHSVDWDRLYDYVFDEVEALRFIGSGIAAISDYEHEYTWYVRDGYLVRSPVRVNGAEASEAARDAAEEEWLRRVVAGEPAERIERDSFFDFGFEPGSYLVVGRQVIDDRELIEVEYYPRRSFSLDESRDESEGPPAWRRDLLFGAPLLGNQAGRAKSERLIGRGSLVTLLVDPQEKRIFRATIESPGLEGLPGWLVRVDAVRASIQMHRPFGEVWLPQRVSLTGTLITAQQAIDVEYARIFSNYRRTDVGAGVTFGRPRR